MGLDCAYQHQHEVTLGWSFRFRRPGNSLVRLLCLVARAMQLLPRRRRAHEELTVCRGAVLSRAIGLARDNGPRYTRGTESRAIGEPYGRLPDRVPQH